MSAPPPESEPPSATPSPRRWPVGAKVLLWSGAALAAVAALARAPLLMGAVALRCEMEAHRRDQREACGMACGNQQMDCAARCDAGARSPCVSACDEAYNRCSGECDRELGGR